MTEYLEKLNMAQNHFDWADSPEEVDIAIYELKAAELSLSNFLRLQKEEEGL